MSSEKNSTLPVPFVTLWSDEMEEFRKNKIHWTPKGLAHPAPDSRGVRWAQFGGSMRGIPLFASVHPIRQKMCMEGPYCSVCGKLLKTASKIPWILNGITDPSLEEIRDMRGSFLTMTPPTCSGCMLMAEQLCPHLKAVDDKVRLLVTKFSIVGVSGDLYQKPNREDAETNVFVRFGTQGANLALKFFSAKQLVVEIRQYKIWNR